MTIGIKVGSIIDEIGSSDFFNAFFSTICVHCESCSWGSKFPILMKSLYKGSLTPSESKIALSELTLVKKLLSEISPKLVVWDIDDLKKQPPWGNNISNEITNLSNYFVTSTGRDLIETLMEAIDASAQENNNANIVTY